MNQLDGSMLVLAGSIIKVIKVFTSSLLGIVWFRYQITWMLELDDKRFLCFYSHKRYQNYIPPWSNNNSALVYLCTVEFWFLVKQWQCNPRGLPKNEDWVRRVCYDITIIIIEAVVNLFWMRGFCVFGLFFFSSIFWF